MDITNIEAKTLPEAWFLCVQGLVKGGMSYASGINGIHRYKIDSGSFAGQERIEYDLVTVHIEYPNSRPLIPETPVGIPPVSSIQYVADYLPYLMTDAPPKKNEVYTYGQDVCPQMEKIIEMYRKGRETNQCCISVGSRESIGLEHSQCLRLIDTRIQDGKLHFIVYFRSWDLWAGFPTNMAAIQMLKEYMAEQIDVQDGELIAVSKGLHLYDYTWELAKILVLR